MPLEESLTTRIHAKLRANDDVIEKSIVGGLGFTWRGHLLCGVMGGDLLVRVGKVGFGSLVTQPGARPMTMAGRESTAWIIVHANYVTNDASLQGWLDHAIDFVRTLPPK
jgi:hypothetical protein